MIGTIGIGWIADRIGITPCLLATYFCAVIAVLIVLITQKIIFVMCSSFLMGLLFLSIVSLSSAQLSKLIPHHYYASFWSVMTALFALSQTFSAYGMSHLAQYGATGYVQIFEIAFGALLLATFILLIFRMRKVTLKC